MCCGCSKEPSHLDGSFEHTQHIFWMRKKENNFPTRNLIWRPDLLPQSLVSSESSLGPQSFTLLQISSSLYRLLPLSHLNFTSEIQEQGMHLIHLALPLLAIPKAHFCFMGFWAVLSLFHFLSL